MSPRLPLSSALVLTLAAALSSAWTDPAHADSTSSTIVLTPGKTWKPTRKSVIFAGPRPSTRKNKGQRVETTITRVKLEPRSKGAPKNAVRGATNGKSIALKASDAAVGHEYIVTVSVRTREWRTVERIIGRDVDGRPLTRVEQEELPPKDRNHEYPAIVPLPRTLSKLELVPGESTTLDLPDSLRKVRVLRAQRKRSEVELLPPPKPKKKGETVPPTNILKITARSIGTERYVVEYQLGGKRLNTTLPVRVKKPKARKPSSAAND